MRNIIVYLGPKLPKYVKKNINYLSSIFPDQKFVILIDYAKNYSKKKLKNVEIIRCQDPIISWSAANQILSKENHFKNDFWYKTLARFKVLEEYMKDNNESIMHIEADVLLSKNFPFDRVKLIDKKFGYCLVNDKQGIASLLYIKNYEAAKILLHFSEELLSRDPKFTDMDILGALYKEKQEDVYILPTIDSESVLLADSFKTDNLDIKKNFFKFNGLFDAATLGQFFFGLDRVHTNGFLRTKIYLPHHYVDPRKLNMVIDDGNFYLFSNDNKVEIFNLHLHSKINKFFSLNSKNLKNFIDNKKFKRIGTFSIVSYYNSKIYIFLHQITKIRNFLD